MADTFLVRLARGANWDHAITRRAQSDWDAHAAFMDALTADGFVILGGPVGEGDGDDVLLVVSAEDDAAIRDRLADDPWLAGLLLTIRSIEPWSVWLRAQENGAPSR